MPGWSFSLSSGDEEQTESRSDKEHQASLNLIPCFNAMCHGRKRVRKKRHHIDSKGRRL